MKKILILTFALALSIGISTAYAQAGKKKPNPIFTKATHDFGKIAESVGSASCEFSFKNMGDAPLIIQRVQASCGCTTPEYPTQPILPGKEAKIKVTYATIDRVGTFDKKIIVFSNVPDSVYTLTVKGEVTRR